MIIAIATAKWIGLAVLAGLVWAPLGITLLCVAVCCAGGILDVDQTEDEHGIGVTTHFGVGACAVAYERSPRLGVHVVFMLWGWGLSVGLVWPLAFEWHRCASCRITRLQIGPLGLQYVAREAQS